MAKISHPEASAEGFTQANTDAPEGGEERASKKNLREVAFHVLPTLEEGAVGAVVERTRALIEKDGGSVSLVETPKRMTLAYPIERSTPGKHEKYSESYFGYIRFSAEPQVVAALQTALQADEEVLRFLVTEAIEIEERALRAVFASDRLEGETIKKPVSSTEETHAKVSDEELDKSIEALVN